MSIDESTISTLVHAFYQEVRKDRVLGPIFESRITEWDVHLARMCTFWSSVMLRTGQFRGQPMQKHQPLPIDASHFDRWLALFEATAHRVLEPDAAKAFIERARNIAQSLEMGVAAAQGAILAPGQRYHAPPAERRRLPIQSSEATAELPLLPVGLVAYKRTAEFDEVTLPAALRRKHSTRKGVWGVIHVSEGRLRYRTLDVPTERVLEAGQQIVVLPEQPHEVEPMGPMRMFVQFHRKDDVADQPD